MKVNESEPKIYISDIDPNTWDPCNGTEFVFAPYTIRLLDYADLPYTHSKLLSDDLLTRERSLDVNSIPTVMLPTGELVYFPTNMLQYAFALLDAWAVDRADPSRLVQVECIAAKLIEMSLASDSDLLVPYCFDFPLHGDRSGEVMVNPWYSAMAQGQTLSLFCRLHELTGKQGHLDACHLLYNSFGRMKGRGHRRGYPVSTSRVTSGWRSTRASYLASRSTARCSLFSVCMISIGLPGMKRLAIFCALRSQP